MKQTMTFPAKALLLIALLVTGSFQAGAQGYGQDTTHYGSFLDRDYILDKPRSESFRGKRKPLIIFLHGAMGRAPQVKRHLNYNMRREMEKQGFMVAYLSGYPMRLLPRRGVWNAGRCCGDAKKDNADDVSYINSFIKYATRRHKADRNRVYLIGHSNGAMMAYRYACEYPGRVAAIVTVSGTLMYDGCKARGLGGVLHIHGAADSVVPVTGGRPRGRPFAKAVHNSVAYSVKVMRKNGVPIKVRLLEEIGHNLSDIDDRVNLAKTSWRFFRTKSLRK